MSLSIQTRRQGDREIVLALYGEVHYATARDLRATISATLDAGDVDVIIVDLTGVTFLDSTGVGTLVVAKRICADLVVEFRVSAANPFIVNLITAMGVADRLDLPAAPGGSPRARSGPVYSPAA